MRRDGRDRLPVRPRRRSLARSRPRRRAVNSGSSSILRARYWMVWNEPNLNSFLLPQFVDRNPASPAISRSMVNAVANAVKAVDATNVVVAGKTMTSSLQAAIKPPLMARRAATGACRSRAAERPDAIPTSPMSPLRSQMTTRIRSRR